MGFLDFLKRFSSNREDKEKKEITKIELSEVSSWIDSYNNKILGKVNKDLGEIRAEVNEEKNALQENIKNLENAQLKNTDIPDRAKQIMEGNRQTYIQKLKALLEKVAFPENFDQALSFAESFDKTLENFDKGITRNHFVMEEFFGKKASVILASIRNIDRLMKKTKEVAESSEVKKIIELKKELNNTLLEIKRKDVIKKKIKLEKENLEVSRELLKEKENKTAQLQQEKSHQEVLEKLNKKEEFEKLIAELNQKQTHSFIEIEAALKKYYNLSENKTAKKYLENSIGALSEDKNLEILTIIEAIKKAIAVGEIGLKEKKKDKVSQGLEVLNKNCLEEFLQKSLGLNSSLEKLKFEIDSSEILKEAEQLKQTLKQAKTDVEENKLKIEKLEKDFEEINVQDLAKNLETKMSYLFNKEIKIVAYNEECELPTG